jgi:COMPASS component SWD1
VLLSTGDAYVVDRRKNHRGRIELEEPLDADEDVQRYVSLCFYTLFLRLFRSAMTMARFDPSGKYIFIGTAAGTLLVFNSRTKTVSTT